MNQFMFKGKFGLERETLRVDENNRLAQTFHPFEDENLSRDFCENQLEIITPVCNSISEVMSSLAILDKKAREILKQNHESLWLYSNPPYIQNDKEIPIAQYDGMLSAKHDYRISLARRYGKRMMLYSGIHFNFSFSEEYLESLNQDKNQAYFRLSKQVSKYSWLLVLLMSASPMYDLSFDKDNASGTAFSGYSSMRNSKRGYWNQFIPELDYSNLASYINSIQNYIKKGILFSAGELYLPVRLKPKGENSLEKLLTTGVDHIELRMFDLNPLEKLGVAQKDLEFTH
ncbi:MAG: glutathione synthase, partial [Oscillospiraceae bacterium]|nr:glutathione synthase [Oscillospiraceae bacterium]